MQDRRRSPRFIRIFGTHTRTPIYMRVYVRRLRKSVLSATMGQKEIDSKSRVRAAAWFGRSVEIRLNK